ncbi:MAG: thioredoxin domain-containing protein [Bacteroidia bacterium]|nr:thioredoxin domain-containing protein [Bacteroidia bacterium]
MNRIFTGVFFVLFMFVFSSCNSQTGKNATKGNFPYTNELINSTSPYLQQHAHNPVNWYPWGDEALEKAKSENKLLIISIGYAACHWCHVMEHESFEDTAVARIMNQNFVSIKVDREERPDIDQIYMNAAYLTSGQGGWPLNAIALPDGKPVFAATYFPKEEWLRVLNHFIGLKKNEEGKLIQVSAQITEGIQRLDYGDFIQKETKFTEESMAEAYKNLANEIDLNKGGLNKTPKFPMPNIHQFLLRYYALTGEEEALTAVKVSLDQMAAGGIYDHLGGGFARYSTDAQWKVPHFEKMLYDNAQLVSLYSEAYQLTKDPLYKNIVEETLTFIEREMTGPAGEFYSSLDADSEGEEGKYYVWTRGEIDSLLVDDAGSFLEYYNVTQPGNWEGKNILYRRESPEEAAKRLGFPEETFDSLITHSRQVLLEVRKTRVRPGLDNKTLTAWNALMLKGYADAYRVFGNPEYLQKALKNAQFLRKKQMQKDGRLNRSFKDGRSSVNGFADDYSFTIEAFITLYQVTFDEQWLFEADRLMTYALAHFYDEKAGMFYYTSDQDKALITRTREVADNVIPASNSSLAKGLFILGTYLYKPEYINQARLMLSGVSENVATQAAYFSNWAILQTWFTWPPYEVAIVGTDAENFRKTWETQFLPNVFLLGGKAEGKLELLENKLVEGATYIYVCQDKMCKFPVQNVPEAFKLVTW